MKALALFLLMFVGQAAFADYTKVPNQYIDVKGVKYAYRTIGTGEDTPIVFFQHFLGTMDDWDSELIDSLAKTRRLIIFDNQGVAASNGKTPDSVKFMSKDAIAFINALKLKKVDLLGFSLGGFVAQQILIDKPDLVRKAILAGTGPQGGEGVRDLMRVLNEAQEFNAKTKLPQKAFLFFSGTEKGQKAGAEYVKRINNHTVDAESVSSKETFDAQLKAILAWGNGSSQSALLKKIKIPVLIVNGNNDIMVPTVNSYNMFNTFPNAQLVLYPDSGHAAFAEYRNEFSALVNAFLDAK
jgi:pimeloyl-ACP methyl ester carboxylesterase